MPQSRPLARIWSLCDDPRQSSQPPEATMNGSALRCAAALIALALATLLATILVPSIYITVYALFVDDTAAITTMALRAAEPLAVAGALAVVVYASWRVPAWWLGGATPWRLVVGLVAAMTVVGTAFWAGDPDAWTVLAVAALPVAALLTGARRASATAA
jgi:hypothetical protein